MDLLSDVSHNLAKPERHPDAGAARPLLCVHRKGATRTCRTHCAPSASRCSCPAR
nr:MULTISPECIES: RtcB family protein [unclassified Streptomyces]